MVRFRLAGDGEMIQNLGTTSGARQLELYNGRAIIRFRLSRGESVLSVSAERVRTALLTIRA